MSIKKQFALALFKQKSLALSKLSRSFLCSSFPASREKSSRLNLSFVGLSPANSAFSSRPRTRVLRRCSRPFSNAFLSSSCGILATAVKPDANGSSGSLKPKRFAQLLLGVRRPRSPRGGNDVCSQKQQDRKAKCMVNGARARASGPIRGLHLHEPSIAAACCPCARGRKRRANEPATEVKDRRDDLLGQRKQTRKACLPRSGRSRRPALAKCWTVFDESRRTDRATSDKSCNGPAIRSYPMSPIGAVSHNGISPRAWHLRFTPPPRASELWRRSEKNRCRSRPAGN